MRPLGFSMAKSLVVNLIRFLKNQPFGPRFVLSSFFVITLLTLMLRMFLISSCRPLNCLAFRLSKTREPRNYRESDLMILV